MTRRNSLRWKLTWLIAAGSAFTAILSAAGFTWLHLQRYRQHLEEEIAAIGAIVADQVGPAITLGDHNAAHEILLSLKADAELRDAALYDRRVLECYSEGPTPAIPLRRTFALKWTQRF